MKKENKAAAAKTGAAMADPGRHRVSSAMLVRRFWPYQKKYLGTILLDLFCAALTCLCDLVLPLILRTITNTAMKRSVLFASGKNDRCCCTTGFASIAERPITHLRAGFPMGSTRAAPHPAWPLPLSPSRQSP